MSHNIKENDQDVSNIDDITDNNNDNIDKITKTDEPSGTEPELFVDEQENSTEQDVSQEESRSEGTEKTGEEIRKEQKSTTYTDTSGSASTSTTTTLSDTTTNGGAGTASTSGLVVAPSPGSDSKFYAIRTTGGQERVVANVLQNKIKSKNIGIYSILLLENFKGYIIVEAPDANIAFQALAGVRHIRGQIRGELPFKDIEGYLVKKPVVTELSVDDTVEVIGGPFKAMKAKITRVDYEKQEATVVLLDSPYQIPVTVDANYLKKAAH
jgi:transcriptional antiterminator NusG